MKSLSDEQLALEIAEGRPEALGEALRRFGPAVAAMAALMSPEASTRERILIDSFIALWRLAPAFDPSRAAFRTWFITLAHRRAVLTLRSEEDHHGSPTPDPSSLGDAAESADATPPVSQWSLVRDALGGEFEDDELVFEAFFRGLTHQELARRRGLPFEVVRSALRRGLVRLSRSLAGRVGRVGA